MEVDWIELKQILDYAMKNGIYSCNISINYLIKGVDPHFSLSICCTVIEVFRTLIST